MSKVFNTELSELIGINELDQMFFEGGEACVKEGVDCPAMIVTVSGTTMSLRPVNHMMDRKENIGELLTSLVNDPSFDVVAHTAHAYAMFLEPDTETVKFNKMLHRCGVSIKDLPGSQEVVTVIIYDKTKPQCECWTAHHVVKGKTLTRDTLHQINYVAGRMAAPIPRAPDASNH